MIKCFLVLPGGIFPIQVRKRTLKHLAAAMQKDFSWRVRYILPVWEVVQRVGKFIRRIFES